MNRQAFDDFLESISMKPLRVLDSAIGLSDYVAIDLSSKNKALEQIDVSSSNVWKQYINDYLTKHNALVAYGGYLEKRAIYRRSTYFNHDNPENERDIHIGIDLWCTAGTKILAVLDGEIHSYQNNTNFGDYGPTIILKHRMNDVEFYSLYGHLSLDSITTLKVGAKVQQGETIGTLGDSVENGDYAPHVHFQLIKNIERKFGDYPGVCSKNSLGFYLKNCPSPNLLLKLQ